MSHVIAYPDDLFQKISSYASKRGKTPEEVLIALVEREMVAEDETTIDEGIIPEDHPFFQLSGIIHGNDPGWSDRHDDLIAKAIMDEHAEQK